MNSQADNSITGRIGRYRASIRREANSSHFQLLRSQMLTQKDFDSITDLLHRLRDTSSESADLQEMLVLLDRHGASANFNMQINSS